MMRRRMWWVGGVVLMTVLGVLLAPIGVLWCPGASSWRAHLYRNLMYDQIARAVTAQARTPQEAVERLAEYAQTHIWPAFDVAPYDGKPLDYLVRGIGWCDYQAKALLRLSATRQIPVRYAMLRRADGESPHTIAEVWMGNRWGAYDVLWNIRFLDAGRAPLTLDALSEQPEWLDVQSTMRTFHTRCPATAHHIQELYTQVLPVPLPPRRSAAGTSRLTVVDRLLFLYAHGGGSRFVAWYQDRYLASIGLAHPSGAAETLQRARHWHLAGRAAEAKQGYQQCLAQAAGTPLASEAQFWLGLLQWEVEHDASGALETLTDLLRRDPGSRWISIMWYYMGRCEEALERLEQARGWFAQASAAGIAPACTRLGSDQRGAAASLPEAASRL